MNQPSEERVQGGSRQWVCSTCGLVLKEEEAPSGPAPAPEAVLGRVPIRKISQPELAAAKLAEEKAAAAKAAAAAVAAVAAAKAAAEKASKASAPAPAKPKLQAGPEGLEFDQSSASDFEIEMGGEVKVISGTSPRAAEAFASEIEFDRPGAPAPRPASKPSAAASAAVPAPAAASAAGAALFDRVIIAEDSALLREMAKDSLVRAGLGRQVRSCADAMEMLQLVAESVAAGVAVDLIIIDIDMPVLSGHQAAIALRAFEKGMKAKPTPILFFTAFPCDERLKKVLDLCQPARYLNKGTDAAPDRIAARLVQVLSNLRRQG